jgi:glycine/D-amino acid oxidase-like deaminating enzyme/nitrite reductase/ring-hydroxylating ferredoxin subunit
MTDTTSGRQSLWLDTAPETNYPQLAGDLEFDVAVIGGGIAGLTAALRLKREGAQVAVLEAGRVGGGVTGCTTAKVSALQSTTYTQIRGRHSEATAAAYAAASLAGVEELARMVEAESIECELERRDAFTYAATAAQRSPVEDEFRHAEQARLPVELVDGVDVPFETFGAVRLGGQLQLHPVKLAQGLAAAIDGDGSAVYETTRAMSVSEATPGRVRTPEGSVRAGHVIVATHFPFLDRGVYFARLKPQRSYCVAAELRTGRAPAGMSISAGPPTRSIRGDGRRLIVGGEGHSPGASQATPERFERLEAFAREHWDVARITHRWSAQDPSHYDHLPVIGPYRPGSSRLWVSSGFMKWGFSTAAFGALLLTDLINGRANDWAGVFTPSRVSPRSLPETAELGVKFGVDFVADRIKLPQARSVQDVPAGEARVVGTGPGRAGVFRDDDGGVHAVSLRCTHLGCLLRFNSAERSWDCPCHGSRFDVDGRVLEGPAVRDLDRRG